MGIFEAGVALQQVDVRVGVHDVLVFGNPQFFDSLLLLGDQRRSVYLRRLLIAVRRSRLSSPLIHSTVGSP